MSASKDRLRELYILKREKIPEHSRQEMDRRIRDNLFKTIALDDVSVIHTYLPIKNKKEVDTTLIVDQLAREYPEIKISLPFAVMSERILRNFYWQPGDKLIENSWGIPEPDPESSEEVETSDIDLVIVPLLAFDFKGHRVGYGAGFYDRFLADCREETLIVGVSHFEHEDQWIKSEEFDIDLNCCITPDRIYNFNK